MSEMRRSLFIIAGLATDIEAEVQRLAKVGVQFSRFAGLAQTESGVWHSPSGAKIAWFSDPDGNTLSLTER